MTADLVAIVGGSVATIATLLAASWGLSGRLTRIEAALKILPCQSGRSCLSGGSDTGPHTADLLAGP